MKILIAGDLFISDRFRGARLYDPSVESLFAAADFRIVNLEAPLTARRRRHNAFKKGPHLGASGAAALPFLQGLGVNLATLATNHVMDFGRAGLAETLENLRSAGIAAVGAGLDTREAARPFVLESGGTRIAVLNFGETEWGAADRGGAGANPLDVIENVRQIREARRTCEFAVVVIHGGQEDYPLPTPRMVRQYRFYAENGASAVVGHHPHRISGFEVHQGCPIFYSLGNFIFTLPSEYEWWYRGLVLGLRFRPGRPVEWEHVPVAQAVEGHRLTRLEGESGAAVRREVEDSSRIIADEALLNRAWDSYLDEFETYYLNFFSPLGLIRNAYVRTALGRLGIDRLFFGRSHYAEMLNTMRCETHAEAAKAIMARWLG